MTRFRRIPACLVAGVVWNAGLYGIGYALPLASVVQVLVGYVFFASGRWKRGAGLESPQSFEGEAEITGQA